MSSAYTASVHIVPLSARNPDGFPEPVLEALRRICNFRQGEVEKLNPENQRLLATAEAVIARRLDLEMQLFGGPTPADPSDRLRTDHFPDAPHR